MIHKPSFQQLVGEALFTKVKLIKDLGNLAVHSSRKISATDAVTAIVVYKPQVARQSLIKSSFPRRRESISLIYMGSRLRGIFVHTLWGTSGSTSLGNRSCVALTPASMQFITNGIKHLPFPEPFSYAQESPVVGFNQRCLRSLNTD
ncbi:MAG: hypothetical protein CTY19_09730 [Methylomonas sp.]|nr:MAG: hypothetical protein CTY19_09730 [Methylomonas sp.]